MTAALTPLPRGSLKRWTKREYMDLVERGAFHRQRVYLFRGDIIDMSPQTTPHAIVVMNLTHVLVGLFGSTHRVRIQLPFETPGESMPEPDAAVCTMPDALRTPHPAAAILVVEVSVSSLPEDRTKAFEYAAATVPEYWIVDVGRRQVEVFRNLVADSDAPLGWRYTTHFVVPEAGEIRPISQPESIVQVAQLLPPAEAKSSE